MAAIADAEKMLRQNWLNTFPSANIYAVFLYYKMQRRCYWWCWCWWWWDRTIWPTWLADEQCTGHFMYISKCAAIAAIHIIYIIWYDDIYIYATDNAAQRGVGDVQCSVVSATSYQISCHKTFIHSTKYESTAMAKCSNLEVDFRISKKSALLHHYY